MTTQASLRPIDEELIQRETTLNFDGFALEEYSRFLGENFFARMRKSRGCRSQRRNSILGVRQRVGFVPSGSRARN